MSLADIIQEGNSGLLKAAENFNWVNNIRFSAYATPWIKGHIKRAIIEKGYFIRTPGDTCLVMRKVTEARQKLELRQGYSTEENIAAVTGVTARKIRQIQKAFRVNSFDAQINYEDPVDDLTAEDLEENSMQAEKLRNALANLSERERLVIGLRYAKLTENDVTYMQNTYGKTLDPSKEPTLQEIGDLFGGITRERIRQIEKKALKK